MPKRTSRMVWIALLAVTVGSLLPGVALAEQEEEHVMVHKVVVDCDDEEGECADEKAVKIFISGDGELHEIHGDNLHWIGAGAHRFLMAHPHAGKGGFLGIMLSDLTPELRAHFGVPEDAGVMVSKVVEASPAETAGIQVGDIITTVDGQVVGSSRALARSVREHDDGETVALEVWREGRLENIIATLEARQIEHQARTIMLNCSQEEEGCDALLGEGFDLDCGGEPCRVEVECHDGDCECTVNGETRDCEAISGLHHKHHP